MSTFYQLKATIEIKVDPSKPDTMVKAAQWMQKMADGEITLPGEGLDIGIEITTGPQIIKRKDT